MQLFDFFKRKKFLGDTVNKDDEELFLGLKKSDNNYSILLSQLREVVLDRYKRYSLFNQMAQDSIVHRALLVVMEDASQYNVESGVLFEVVSEDANLAKILNYHLEKFISPYLEVISFSIAKYGEFIMRVGELEENPEIGLVVPLHLVKNFHNICKIVEGSNSYFVDLRKVESHLVIDSDFKRYGMTFQSIPVNVESTDIFSSDKFIHFCNFSLENSIEVSLNDRVAVLVQGESVLLESLAEIYRIIVAIENAIIAARLAKSKLVRFAMVETSKIDNDKASSIVDFIDSAINKNEVLTDDSSEYSALRFQSEPVTVVIPIKGDKGRVTLEEFSSQVDLKELVDLNHFMGKFFAGLSIPRSYFYYDEQNVLGQGTSGSFMRTDIRYYRTPRRIQKVLYSGVKDYLEVVRKKLKLEGKYDLRVNRIHSPEDEEFLILLEQRMNMLATLESIIQNESAVSLSKLEFLEDFFTHVFPHKRFKDVFVKYIKSIKENKLKNPQKEEGEGEDLYGMGEDEFGGDFESEVGGEEFGEGESEVGGLGETPEAGGTPPTPSVGEISGPEYTIPEGGLI